MHTVPRAFARPGKKKETPFSFFSFSARVNTNTDATSSQQLDRASSERARGFQLFSD
jgi:hypothetical protein